MSTITNMSHLDISEQSLLDMPFKEVEALAYKLAASDVTVIGGVDIEEYRRGFAGPPKPRDNTIFEVLMRMRMKEIRRRIYLEFGPSKRSSISTEQNTDTASDTDSASDIDSASDVDSDVDASQSDSSARSLKRRRSELDHDTDNDGDVESVGENDSDCGDSDKENVAPPPMKRVRVYRDVSPAASDSSSGSSWWTSRSTASSESLRTPIESPMNGNAPLPAPEAVCFMPFLFSSSVCDHEVFFPSSRSRKTTTLSPNTPPMSPPNSNAPLPPL